MMMNNQQRDELLIRLDERTDNLIKKFDDHLTIHKWFNRIGLGAVASFIAQLMMWVVGK